MSTVVDDAELFHHFGSRGRRARGRIAVTLLDLLKLEWTFCHQGAALLRGGGAMKTQR
jgi:hypothetical protein